VKLTTELTADVPYLAYSAGLSILGFPVFIAMSKLEYLKEPEFCGCTYCQTIRRYENEKRRVDTVRVLREQGTRDFTGGL
jgi:predicted adenine nucleotide alpha hydrolase (AANH) superfamily ATPase